MSINVTVTKCEFKVTSSGAVTLLISGKNDTGVLTIRSGGAPGPAGPGLASGGISRSTLTKNSSTDQDTSWKSNFFDYVVNVEYTGVETDIFGGKVYTAELEGETLYRFISTSTNLNGYPTEDSFYFNFDSNVLSDLIVTRG